MIRQLRWPRPHWIDPERSVPRTAADPRAAQRSVALVKRSARAPIDRIVVVVSPSQPPSAGCCDNRLKPPSDPYSKSVPKPEKPKRDLCYAAPGKVCCAFHGIRPSVPRASGRAFHEHPATLVRGLRGFSSLLIASPAVKGVGGAEGCPREGPARPAPRRPGGWRCRARGRGRWASRGEGHAHCPASARLSAPVLRSDGPSRAMR